jgi:carboxyl-terminal processing protease
MNTLLKPVIVFGLSSVLSLAILHLADGGGDPGSRPLEAAASSRDGAYDLTRLELIDEMLSHVRESYVEPERVNPDRMFTAAIEAVERAVPEAMFRREGNTVAIQVADYSTAVQLGPILQLDDLSRELRRIAVVLRDHLEPSDIPESDATLDPYAMIEFAMANGALETLDPHSMLLPPAESREMDVENRGEFGGLGISIEMEDGHLVVEYPMPGTPAHDADVRAGDRIRRIDQVPTINMSIEEAIELLRGPVGAPVVLELTRAGVADPWPVTVKRANIKVSPVEAFPLPGGYGYARVRTFHSTAAADLRDELAAVERAEGPLRGLVLDLRDNPGGYLNQAVAVADLFLSAGEIVSTRSARDVNPAPEVASARNTQADYPVVVLVNASSASASEIVAGALRNNERAVIVGQRTFGKGSVQNLHTVPHDSKLKITIAQYLTPGDWSIQSVGIPADIELVPSYVGLRKFGGAERADVSLFSHERVRRESDLDAHLVSGLATEYDATYTLRYPMGWDAQPPLFDAPDLDLDYDVAFALSLLQVAPGARRPEMLAAADGLVGRTRRDQGRAIEKSFLGIGVDWRPGPLPADPKLDARLEVVGGGFVAGERATVRVTVHNQGTAALHQVVVVTEQVGLLGEHEQRVSSGQYELLEGLEFPVGYLPAGEARSFETVIDVDAGYPSEVSPVRLSVRTASLDATSRAADGAEHGELWAGVQEVAVQGRELPAFAWQWRILPPADGSVDAGDEVEVEVEVENVGLGSTTAATARIKNRAGRALDILTGTLQLGDPVDRAGVACDPEADVVGCRYELAPGAKWTGRFTVRVIEPLSTGYGLHLSLGDGEAFDYGAVVRGGFYGYYRQEEELRFGLGTPLAASVRRAPPEIKLTRLPGLRADSDLITVSGRASDADGLAHLLVYAGDDKVFFEGSRDGQELRTVPFSADVRLRPGRNTISVLATDASGMTATTSRVIFLPSEPERLSRVLEP